jgi:hypothetical protein
LHTIAVLSGLLDMGIQYGAPWIKNREWWIKLFRPDFRVFFHQKPKTNDYIFLAKQISGICATVALKCFETQVLSYTVFWNIGSITGSTTVNRQNCSRQMWARWLLEAPRRPARWWRISTHGHTKVYHVPWKSCRRQNSVCGTILSTAFSRRTAEKTICHTACLLGGGYYGVSFLSVRILQPVYQARLADTFRASKMLLSF